MNMSGRVVGALVIVTCLNSGCASEGADELARQLLWATNWMNVTRQSERQVEYTHHHQTRYWIIALPPNSSLFQFGNTGIPQAVVAVVEDCARGGKPILALIEDQAAQCVYPAYPEALNAIVVPKEAGQSTRITLVRGDAGVRILRMD